MLVKVRTIDYDRKMTAHPTSSPQCPVPKGWRELYDQLVGDLGKVDRDIAVIQAKQKFGGLRVYIDRLSPEAARLIEIASRVSRRAKNVAQKRKFGPIGTDTIVPCAISTLTI